MANNTADHEKKKKQAEQEAQRAYDQLAANSGISSDTEEAMQAYKNRQPFAYDPANDGLYAGYERVYEKQGKQAMDDTAARAAELSGGYANSYGVSAGSKAYETKLDQLAQVIPELYQIAQERYDRQNQQLLQEIELLTNRDNEAYRRLGEVADRADRRLQAIYEQYADQRDFDYQLGRDATADRQWQQQFDHEKAVDYQTQQLASERLAHEKAMDKAQLDRWTVKDTQTLEEIINTYFPLDDGLLTTKEQNQQLQDLLDHFGFTQDTDLGRSIYQKYRYTGN